MVLREHSNAIQSGGFNTIGMCAFVNVCCTVCSLPSTVNTLNRIMSIYRVERKKIEFYHAILFIT